jgi:hypothetical protein
MKIAAIGRRLTGLFAYLYFASRWYLSIAKNRNLISGGRAHLLVVRSPIYAGMASICLRSFAYYNPKFRIIIHTDEQTLRRVQRKTWLARKLSPRLIQIVRVPNTRLTWQEQKLRLVISLSGTSDIFMDADLRWNKSLPDFEEKIYFLVEEFEIGIKELSFDDSFLEKRIPPSFMMKNTSFFSWNKMKITNEDQINLFDIYKSICYGDSKTTKMNQAHLSEQLALSMLINEPNYNISYLKSTDSQYDGGIVESSYFGASGRRFGIFGDMNSRI